MTTLYLHQVFGIGSAAVPAPQATLMATIIKGLLSQNLPWGLVLVGVFISVTLELCGIHSLSFAVGSYLPIATTAPIFAGGLVRAFVERKTGAAEESEVGAGTLFSSGLIAGGSLCGILYAVLVGTGNDRPFRGDRQRHAVPARRHAAARSPSALLFLALAVDPRARRAEEGDVTKRRFSAELAELAEQDRSAVLRSRAIVVAARVCASPRSRRRGARRTSPRCSPIPASITAVPIVVVGKVALDDRTSSACRTTTASIRLVFKGNAPDGLDEVRGEFWDIGRMKPDDPRLSGYDLRATFKIDPDGAVAAARRGHGHRRDRGGAAPPPAAPRRRSARIVLNPSRYLDQKVTITGQSPGRNLLGDLPDAPAQEPLRLRAALGRRGDLGREHAAEDQGRERQGFRARPRRADRHRAAG